MDELHPTRSKLEILEAALDALTASELTPSAEAAARTLAQEIHTLFIELESSQAEALSARQDKSHFISVITHELRVPLTSIKGYTDLLRYESVGALNDQQKSFLNTIRSNTDRMAVLIAGLADLSSLQSGRLRLQKQTVNLAQKITELIQSWQERLDEKNQHISVELSPDLPAVQIDLARFNQVLACLLSNAHNYSPAGGQLTLRASNIENSIHIEVQDTGIGIRPEDQEHIFTPFFRSDDSLVRATQGWGFALHLARLLIEYMGGEMGFTSQHHSGSTFWYNLPID
jgi:signal transduction histidine kinase